ncbi:SKI-like proto-oncogene b [Chanos chanos]|uniref:SKI-like proto-oncogene b n=1 Tax=Chanos chanos TaxID=29144 RepID=A0A6J2UWS1_CHACN|nr:ski-like protein [Chanos chanos]
MASVQNKLFLQESAKGPVKRQNQGKPREATPIKKRVMASMNLTCRKIADSFDELSHVRVHNLEKKSLGHLGSSINRECQQVPNRRYGTDGALDLSPGLRHTLAQFTLSSQCSLGGPAAFSDHNSQDKLVSRLTQEGTICGPLLVPPDSSTELVLCNLEGECISCFSVGGELRLCLPQVLNTVLRDFSLHQINSVCDQLYVYCSRCDAAQLHVLKVLGVLPLGAPSCGLITLTDAQRLCNALLHPGDNPTLFPLKEQGRDGEEEEEEVDAGGLWVEHQCLGKCQGVFVPHLYACPDAPCIRCSQCRLLFSPKRFVMHSHRQPDKRTCHWGFDSAKWACYLQLGSKHRGTADKAKNTQLLENMKLKFHNNQREMKLLNSETGQTKQGLDHQLQKGKPHESNLEEKAESSPAFCFDPQLLANMKDLSKLGLMWQSWYHYMHDNLIGSAPSLSPGCVVGKQNKEESSESEMQENPLKQESSQEADEQSQNHYSADQNTSPETGSMTVRSAAVQSEHEGSDKWQKEKVSIETQLYKRLCNTVHVEENNNTMVIELLQMYSAQHNKLQSTLQKQRQLEKELQVLGRDEAADQCSLQGELEAVQTEHAQRLGEVQQEQKKLKNRLEQLRNQSCRCKETKVEQHQETHYAVQLSELRQRLDRAEEDRVELQEQLRREREAREKLERTIAQLKQQMKESVAPACPASPLSTTSSELQMSPSP